MKSLVMCAAAVGWLASSAATAGDGVIEINQAAALKGAVTPGDAPGFPVTLSLRGSYLLTSNLDSPIGAGAIVITSTFVTLDLGGFTVASTNVCTGYPTTSCTVTSGGAHGISASASQYLVVVRNGVVTAMGGNCLQLLGPSSEVDRVRAFGCGGVGIDMDAGGASRVTNNFVGLNFSAGIVVRDGSTVEGNEIRANGSDGVIANGPRLPVQISDNRIFDNNARGAASVGLLSAIVTKNLFAGNIQGSFAGVVSLGDNRCTNVGC